MKEPATQPAIVIVEDASRPVDVARVADLLGTLAQRRRQKKLTTGKRAS